jgi:hypothetical protein
MNLTIALLAGAAAVALAPAALAHDQRPSVVLNGQMNFSDVQGLNVVSAQSANGVAAGSVGLGNTMTAQSDNRSIEINSNQEMYGNTNAFTGIHAGALHGATVGTAVAQGNAAQTSVCCGAATGQVVQVNRGHETTAGTLISAGSGGNVLAAASAATGNNAANGAWHGYVDLYTYQFNSSRVAATSIIEACCNNGSATASSQAAANAVTLSGESSTQFGAVEQINDGEVVAYSGISMNVATNPTAASNAAGNTAVLDNKWGYAQLDGYQENNGQITSNSEITLNDFHGVASVGSNAIGNSSLLSNIGSDATTGMFQNNTGNVAAYSTFNGATSSGGVGVVTATAIGNAQTVATCVSCSDGSVKVEGYATQLNYGNVTAVSTVNAGAMGSVVSNATAVGNSATFIARQGH